MKEKTKQNKIEEFIRESNAIEREYSEQAFKDAVRAWNYLKKQKLLTLETILRTHYLLMQNLDPKIAGKWRNCDVWIGGQKKFFVSEALIEEEVKKLISVSNILLKWGKNKNKKTKENICKLLHIGFEHIHGHCDGNGRVYRLIMNWHRIQFGLPVLIIHADIEDGGNDQSDYYLWFKDGNNRLTEFLKQNNIKQ